MSIETFISGLRSQSLKIPTQYKEDFRNYTMTGSNQSEKDSDRIDERPFERFVDFWWLAMCIGIQEGKRTELVSNQWYPFVRAEVLSSNPWRIFQLQLLAIGVTKDTEILNKSKELVSMLDEYAATGLPILLNVFTETEIPIWEMTKFISSRLESGLHL